MINNGPIIRYHNTGEVSPGKLACLIAPFIWGRNIYYFTLLEPSNDLFIHILHLSGSKISSNSH